LYLNRMETATRLCLQCAKPLKGRIDKKFCDDYCRSRFNNRLNSEINPCIRSVNNILRKNRRILAELIPFETAKTTRERLMEKGFNFQYVTNTYINKKGTQYYFCYEFGYLPLEDGWYFLLKRK